MASASSIQNLPDELLIKIFNHLSPVQRTSMLGLCTQFDRCLSISTLYVSDFTYLPWIVDKNRHTLHMVNLCLWFRYNCLPLADLQRCTALSELQLEYGDLNKCLEGRFKFLSPGQSPCFHEQEEFALPTVTKLVLFGCPYILLGITRDSKAHHYRADLNLTRSRSKWFPRLEQIQFWTENNYVRNRFQIIRSVWWDSMNDCVKVDEMSNVEYTIMEHDEVRKRLTRAGADENRHILEFIAELYAMPHCNVS